MFILLKGYLVLTFHLLLYRRSALYHALTKNKNLLTYFSHKVEKKKMRIPHFNVKPKKSY